jgi:hypothetical protein
MSVTVFPFALSKEKYNIRALSLIASLVRQNPTIKITAKRPANKVFIEISLLKNILKMFWSALTVSMQYINMVDALHKIIAKST